MDSTPASLRSFGWGDLPVSMSPKEIDKVHFDHGMTADRIVRLVPDTLEVPSLMLRSATQEGYMVMVANEYGDKPVLLVVKPDADTRAGKRQLVVSLYPKDEGWDWVARQIRSGNLLYRDPQSLVAEKIGGAVVDAQKRFAQAGRPMTGLIPEIGTARSKSGNLSDGYKVLLPSDLRKLEEGGRLGAIQELEARHGDEISKLFGIEPGALTANEAQYLIGFRTTDELRNRVAKARSERSARLRAKALSEPEGSSGGVTRLSRSVSPAPTFTPPAQRAEDIIQSKAATPRPLDTMMKGITQALRIDKMTARAYGKAGAYLDRFTPETIKAGVVSDFGQGGARHGRSV